MLDIRFLYHLVVRECDTSFYTSYHSKQLLIFPSFGDTYISDIQLLYLTNYYLINT